MKNRTATLVRKTKETDIRLSLNLDGRGTYTVDTGIGFFDHMLELFAKHAGIDLKVRCKGDLKVDTHHSVEDVGLCLGEALLNALGDKKGIARYGDRTLPMDEALVQAVLDLGGRPYFVFKGRVPRSEPGGFSPELVQDFFKAVSDAGKLNLHVRLFYGANTHHCIEGIFKAFARALSDAAGPGKNRTAIPSTKGVL
ncbi:MAG: imidazoleglycerol-phosphate dehydratase [Elusimicrobia bacterium RIFOXYB2_FULL_49_7]|nr:MAG: imidazoleglycerol-phosphate dehydratase [Elusimicrobia bacterium RIFOXYB2_FULL_49_7]